MLTIWREWRNSQIRDLQISNIFWSCKQTFKLKHFSTFFWRYSFCYFCPSFDSFVLTEMTWLLTSELLVTKFNCTLENSGFISCNFLKLKNFAKWKLRSQIFFQEHLFILNFHSIQFSLLHLLSDAPRKADVWKSFEEHTLVWLLLVIFVVWLTFSKN